MENIPNFNAMSRNELISFWSEWERVTKKKAVTLVGVRPNASALVHILANYARNKSIAIGCREEGKASASRYEKECDKIYANLPEDCRW